MSSEEESEYFSLDEWCQCLLTVHLCYGVFSLGLLCLIYRQALPLFLVVFWNVHSSCIPGEHLYILAR